jgi:PAS domain S-box-containing protein
VLPSGKTLYVDSTVTRLQDRDGAVYLMALIRDITAQKEAEARVLRARRRTAFAEAAVHGFVYEWDLLTGVVARSDGIFRMLGYRPEEIADDIVAWAALIHPDDYIHVGTVRMPKLSTEDAYSLEYRLRHRDGHYLHVWDQGVVERDPSGQPLRIVGLTADISARKEIEQELRLTQERLRLAVEKAQLTVATTDADLRYTWIYNPHPDFPAGTVIGKRDDELPLGATAEIMAAKQQVLARGQALRREFTFALRGGEHTFDVTIEPLHAENGSVQGVITAALDITARRRVEEQVRRNEQRLRQMMETSQVGIAFAREDGRVLVANDALLALLGRTRAELEDPGLNWREFTLPCDDAYNEALRRRIDAQGYLPPFERRFLHKDGREIPVMLSATLLSPRAGQDPPDGAGEHVTFAVDLSELKQTQAALEELNATLEQRVLERTAELERSNRELERSNRDLDQFVYITSHDLKSPLRGIDNLSAFIVQDTAGILPAASRDHLAKLRGRVRRLETLLDDLLLYSRAGRRRHAAESVDTHALVQRLVEELKPPQGMEIRIGEDLPRIRCERAPFTAALRSLLENAVKHHHQPAAGVVAISATTRGEWVEFCVADNGPGIAPQYHARIFEVFQTLRPRDELEGSGMGLAIVKKTVESAGGRVWVESAVGEGAAFRFTWPVRTE